IRKEANGYKVLFSATWQGPDDIEQFFDESFSDSLAKFQSGFLEYFKSKAYLAFCTTTTTFFIQRGNKAWLFHDGGCSDGPGYHRFIKSLGLYGEDSNQ
ncbi:MAG TPA: hypothetical protein VFI06_18005, partial [Chitinophagaceae bacterium]|nr:hypothetical protein [Chitinophagaceae bacterium]